MKRKEKPIDEDTINKLLEAFKKGYILLCPKCKSFKIRPYVDENYFSDMQRFNCFDCHHTWGRSD